MSSKLLKRKEEGEPDPEFQVAPMADMLFVLLVFFMSITTTETMQSNIKGLNLPFAEETTKEEESEEGRERSDVVINVKWLPDSRTAEILMAGHPAMQHPDQIVPIVVEKIEKNPLATVLVRADMDTEFSFVSEVMRAAAQAGVGAVSFGVITGGEGESARQQAIGSQQ